MNEANELSESEIRSSLETKWLGRRSFVYETVESTNTVLKDLASRGEPAGTLVLAEYQSAGKGRHGRKWHVPPGSSLLFSLLFRPHWPPEQAQWLMMIAGLATAETLRSATGLNVKLKWPNDVVIGGRHPWRKCCGILLETEFENNILTSAVLGIGINVNIPESELTDLARFATSLQAELGAHVPRIPLLTQLLLALEQYYEKLEMGKSPREKWKSMLVNIGQPVHAQVIGLDQPIGGIAVDVDDWGRMIIRDSAGNKHSIAAGDVSLIS
jgi:BirA family biotin operon repressor/biotin-[acetyl-CoA-carboxylase] ligase